MKSCLVLNQESVARLHKLAADLSLPELHRKVCHHLTLSFKGELPEGYVRGQEYKIVLSEYGISNKAVAFFAEAVPGCESGNPHVTYSVSEKGKPSDSLDIVEFYQFTAVEVSGRFEFGDSCFSAQN